MLATRTALRFLRFHPRAFHRDPFPVGRASPCARGARKATGRRLDHLRCFHHCQELPDNDYGEFMLDFTWTTYPQRFTWNDEAQWVPQPFQILLAAECERGSQSSPRRNYANVLDDFCKLVGVRAPLKVLIYGTHHLPGREPGSADLKRGIEDVLSGSGPAPADEHYLFCSASWDTYDVLTYVLDRRDPKRLQLQRTG
jgi:hypothetical protein